MSDDYKELSMAELFRMEAEGQLAALTNGLIALEDGAGDPRQLEEMMRAAHSLKGAARIVGLDPAVQVAHVMEDAFVAAQRGELRLAQRHVDRLLTGVDLLTRIAATSEAEMESWTTTRAGEIEVFLNGLKAAIADKRKGEHTFTPFPEPSAENVSAVVPPPVEETPPPAPPPPQPAPVSVPGPEVLEAGSQKSTAQPPASATSAADARFLRVTADNLNRLLGLSGETLVESRWLRPFAASVERMKRLHANVGGALDELRTGLDAGTPAARLGVTLAEAQNRLAEAREFLAARMEELDTYERRSASLAHRLYGEALAVRMRPFGDGTGGFPRMVRDVARQLGKEARFEVIGENTQVDRDILNKLEAPLGHLLRNAIDHGLEFPAGRVAAGKPSTGLIRVEARHSAGKLMITVSDDGRGVDLGQLRAAIVRKKLVTAEMAPRLSEEELLEFLFLPGFSMKETVTEISGRGVGLDVVQSMIKAVRGAIRVNSIPGKGVRFTLQLPLTLSVVRALLVEIAGEPYAFPLGFIARTVRVPEHEVATTEGRQHFAFEGRRVGLVPAHEVLGRPGSRRDPGDLPVVVIGDGEHRYGIAVDRFFGEHEFVVQPLDPRLGKIPDIAAGALLESGAPVLILDVEDIVRSVEKIAATGGRIGAIRGQAAATAAAARKRVLVVDDSLTVRELERKLLESRGYAVEIAVDGMDGWNAVRTGAFDLVISDVDMPRLDGIELTKQIKADAKLRTIPVMIVSYKDREEDRRRGLDAGADYYLTKGSFHDTTMIDAVRDLIGDAVEEGTPA
jgi:two-component system sensor histidine kinase and response regulator WspE